MLSKKELLIELMRNKSVLAIAYSGSHGMGFGDKYSDIDLLVITKNNYYFKNCLDKYRKLDIDVHPHLDLISNLGIFACKTSDAHFDIKFIRLADFMDLIKNHDQEIMYLINTKIVYDPDNIFKDIKSKVVFDSEGAKFKLRLVVYPLRINKFVEIAKKRNNKIYLSNIINQTIENMLRSLYALNNKEFQSMKWIPNEISNFKLKPKNFEKRLNTIHDLNNSTDLNKKAEMIADLGEDIYNLIIKKYPDMVKIKEHVNWMDE